MIKRERESYFWRSFLSPLLLTVKLQQKEFFREVAMKRSLRYGALGILILAGGLAGFFLEGRPTPPSSTASAPRHPVTSSPSDASLPPIDAAPPAQLNATIRQTVRTYLHTRYPAITHLTWTPARLNTPALRRQWPGPRIPSSTVLTQKLNAEYGLRTTHYLLQTPSSVPSANAIRPLLAALHPYSFTTAQVQQAMHVAAQFTVHYWSNDPYTALQEWDGNAESVQAPHNTLATEAAASWLWRYTNPASGILPTHGFVLHSWVSYAAPPDLQEIQSGQSAASFPMQGPEEQIAPIVFVVHPTIHVVQTLWRQHHWALVLWSRTATVQVAWIKNAPTAQQWQVIALNNQFTHSASLSSLIPLSPGPSPS